MKKIAMLVAMNMEAAKLISRMEGLRHEKTAGRKFLCGKIGQAEVVMYICGMGLRRAAIGARALVESYQPDMLVNYGVSGGLVPGLGVGDTVVVTSSCPASGKAYRTESAVPMDEGIAKFAAQVLPDARVAPAATSIGLILNKRRKARLVAKTGAVCIDMESYAAAKTARALDTPLLVIRCMSDTLEPESLLHFFKNGDMAAEKVGAETETVIKKLAEA